MAMARELVNEKSVGESADAIWRNLRLQQEQVLGSHSSQEPAAEESTELVTGEDTCEVEIAINPPTAPIDWGRMNQLALFGLSQPTPKESTIRRVVKRRSSNYPIQQSLF